MQLLKGNRIHIAEDLLRYVVMLAWDHLFGTYRHPDRHPVVEFGLGDGTAAPDGFAAQLALPFRARPEEGLAVVSRR